MFYYYYYYCYVKNDLLNIVREGGGKGGEGGSGGATGSRYQFTVCRSLSFDVLMWLTGEQRQEMEAFSPPIVFYRVRDLALSVSVAEVDFVLIQSSVLLIC